MSSFLQETMDFILAGGGGNDLFRRLKRIRSDQAEVSRFREEVWMRSLLRPGSSSLVVDAFLLDDLYAGKLDGMLALQVSRVLLTENNLWRTFEKLHLSELNHGSDDEPDLVHENIVLYGDSADLAAFNTAADSHQIAPALPEGEHRLILGDERETYLDSPSERGPVERIAYHKPDYSAVVTWSPRSFHLDLLIQPPQCDKATFLDSHILLIKGRRITNPDKKEFSSAMAAAYFFDVADPWGARLSVDRRLLP